MSSQDFPFRLPDTAICSAKSPSVASEVSQESVTYLIFKPVEDAHSVKTSYGEASNTANSENPSFQNELTTGIVELSMVENMPYELLRLPPEFQFPLIVSVNILRNVV